MSTRPTVNLTNFSSRKLHSGRVWTIMRRPNPAYGQLGAGAVRALVPNDDDLQDARAERIALETYRQRFEIRLVIGILTPERLLAYPTGATVPVVVADGDTLCCVCSRSKAREGRCHRVWSAQALVRAGWRVVLDGVELGAP